MNELTKTAFTITSDNPKVQEIIDNNFKTSLGDAIKGFTSFNLYDKDGVGQLTAVDTDINPDFKDKKVTPRSFAIWLGDQLPDTVGEDFGNGYSISIKYTTKVNPQWMNSIDEYGESINTAILKRYLPLNDSSFDILETNSKYWVYKSLVNEALNKSIVDFDPGDRIITYHIDIDPHADINVISGGGFELRDSLDLEGASYVENSFKLDFKGEVHSSGYYIYNNDLQNTIWTEDEDILKCNLEQWMADLIWPNIILVKEKNNNIESFKLKLNEPADYFSVGQPDAYKGKLTPLVLTYQVKLPSLDDMESVTQPNMSNTINMFTVMNDGREALIDSTKSEFKLKTALHKFMSTRPSAANDFVGSFEIDIDKTSPRWPKGLEKFSVIDEMNKNLMLIIGSTQLWGYDNDTDGWVEVEPADGEGFTASWSSKDQTNNVLTVNVNDTAYDRYRITYRAKLTKIEADTPINITNTAKVKGTDLVSDTVDSNIMILSQEIGSASENMQIKVKKYDPNRLKKKIHATFDLYKYTEVSTDKWEWIKCKENLETDEENSEFILMNSDNDAYLTDGTYYMLKETSATDGYLQKDAYFYIESFDGNDDSPRPDGLDESDFNSISFSGVSYPIFAPNYQATIKVKKVDAQDNTPCPTDAEFTLYHDRNCTDKCGVLTYSELDNAYIYRLTCTKAVDKHYLKETNAPTGYDLSNSVYEVEFDEEGRAKISLNGTLLTSDEDGAVAITNVKHKDPDPIEVSLSLSKILSGRQWRDSDSFEFELTDLNGENNGNVSKFTITSKDDEVNLLKDKKFAAGTYAYKLKEIKPADADPNMTYDETEYSVDIAVTENAGVLSSAITVKDSTGKTVSTGTHSAMLDITNTYTEPEPEPDPLDLRLMLSKIINGREWNAADKFDFVLTDVNSGTQTTVTIASKDDSINMFAGMKFTEGTYAYKLKEVKPADADPNMTYNETEYSVNVTVTKNGRVLSPTIVITDGSGNTVSNGTNSAALDITNVYTDPTEPDPDPISLRLRLSKILNGRQWNDTDRFDFILTDLSDGSPSTFTISSKDESVNLFAGKTFGEGNYSYSLKEDKPADADLNMAYDETEYSVSVTVANNAGVLSPAIIVRDGNANVVSTGTSSAMLDITNTYTEPEPEPDPLSLRLVLSKVLNGRQWEDDDRFDFVLTDVSDGSESTFTITSEDERVDLFDGKQFGEGTYAYKLKEVKPADADPNMTYDETEYSVEVTVTKNAGALSSSIIIKDETGNTVAMGAGRAVLEVTNTYVGHEDPEPIDLSLLLSKILNGREWNAGDKFDFILTDLSDGSEKTFTITSKDETVNLFDDRKFGEGTYVYRLKEVKPGNADPNMMYDETEYSVEVTVTKNDGVLTPEITVTKEDGTVIAKGIYSASMSITNTYNKPEEPEKPDKPDKTPVPTKPDGEQNTPNNIKSPPTGDAVNSEFWIAVLGISAVGMILLMRRRKKI